MFDFYLLYQPKVKEKQIIALEALLRPKATNIPVLDYIKSIDDSIQLDKDVIAHCLTDIEKFDVKIPVSVNIHPLSILDSDFIDYAINKLSNTNIIVELVEYQQIDIDSLFISNAQKLKNQGILISIDDFGKDFARTDVAIAIEADEVKFDKALLKDIDINYIKFKHLIFLHSKIRKLCTHNIVFEGVETKAQKNLLELIVEKPIIQGFFFYKPMPLEAIIKLETFVNHSIEKTKIQNKVEGHQVDFLLHSAAKKKQLDLGDKNAVNAYLKENDILGLIYNEDPEKTFSNLREIYFNESSVDRNGVMSMIDSAEKLVIIRNNAGVVVYDNKAHQKFTGRSLVGINPKNIIESSPSYQICIEQDSRLIINDDALYHIDEEVFSNESYHTIREKVAYNNRHFIITNVCSVNKGLNNITRDKLTGCQTREFLNQNLNIYNNTLLAFLDLNGFKKINDNYGHEAGDQCLIEFSSLLRSMLRDKDVVIRYGGDEFIVLFDSTSAQHIENRLINLNETVKSYFKNIGYKLSFSYGLARITDNDISAAIRFADEKMYANKKESKEVLRLVMMN